MEAGKKNSLSVNRGLYPHTARTTSHISHVAFNSASGAFVDGAPALVPALAELVGSGSLISGVVDLAKYELVGDSEIFVYDIEPSPLLNDRRC